MVPSPLDIDRLASPPRASCSYNSGALSAALSPLRNNFELSCRSPLTPRRPSIDAQQQHHRAGAAQKHSTAVKYLSLPSSFPPPNVALGSASTYDGKFSVSGPDTSSSTVFSRSDQPWTLPPTTPALLFGEPRDDEGKLGVMSAINIIVGKTLGVGAYTIPSAIFAGVGSVGMTLALWIIGAIISFCGLAVYLELGTALPKSGGERVYLERIFRHPYMLATCMFMTYVVLLGFSAPNAIVLGEYALYAFNITGNKWNVRVVAVLAVSVLCYTHARHPRTGLKLINVLGMGKLVILAIVIISGVAGGLMGLGAQSASNLSARRLDPFFSDQMFTSTAQRNFSNIWEGSSMQPYNYATALLKVIYCFRGYSTANQVLSEVKNPVRTLRIAAPVALGIVSVAYLAVNVAFFLVVDKDDFKASGVIVAGIFFRNVFGETLGAHVLPFFIIISAAGNIAATSFAQARVNEELAKDGLLPLSTFWTTTEEKSDCRPSSKGAASPFPSAKAGTKTTPVRGLLLHWFVTAAVIVFPPSDSIYNFLVNIGGYPVSVVSVAISGGLLHLQLNPAQRWRSPFPASRVAVCVFLFFNSLLLVLPWIPPADGADGSGGEGEGGFPYYAYPVTALAVLGSGAVYWGWWRVRQGKMLVRLSRMGDHVGGRDRHRDRGDASTAAEAWGLLGGELEGCDER
ncbi:Uu.00g117010.m01.CDS01 [Anthostomella pinea]|uniref:Uu.00g117010.m01.CDS01 n=1 Tax=Anthostomella pinea TaxID=933095 RepID=A0AAI8YH12_9PEZI|nr:Uu.00g117010.m01.CDS01 [Anthostomella pinea]